MEFPLEWVAISFSNVNFSSSSLVAKSCLTLATPQTVAWQVPLSMGFSRQEYWSGLPYPLPGDLSNPGLNPRLLLCRCSLPSEPSQKPKSTRVGSLSLLQGIFPTKDLNWGSLHCRQILCQLSYQEAHIYVYKSFYTTLDKCLRKNIKKTKERERERERRDGEIEEQKLNELGALNMK